MDKKIDVAAIVAQKRAAIAEKVAAIQKAQHVKPAFGVILVGQHPASISYIKGKAKAARAVGMNSQILKFPETLSEEALLAEIEQLNNDTMIHGFIVQLPLPPHIDAERVLSAITPKKDIDGLHPDNLGWMLLGKPHLVPCTPQGIIVLLDALAIGLSGKRVVVVGRSNIVGKPMAMLALERDATVTIAHAKTENLANITREADILIVAIGDENFIDATYLKPGVIVVDVGVNKSQTTGKIVGDVDYEAVKDVVGAITPVPGGVGPLTITMLLENTLKAMCLQHEIRDV